MEGGIQSMNQEIEQRIVEMRFDNEQFEKGAKQTLRTLEKLEGFLDILGEGGMDHLNNALSSMEYRFSRLGVVGAAALHVVLPDARQDVVLGVMQSAEAEPDAVQFDDAGDASAPRNRRLVEYHRQDGYEHRQEKRRH